MKNTDDSAPAKNHPLYGAKINIKGVKCFDDCGSGLFWFAPITFIIGKNNSGKSTILDVIQECVTTSGKIFDGPLARNGSDPRVEFKQRPNEEKIKRRFPSSTSSSRIPAPNYWMYAEKHIIPHEFTWSIDNNNKVRLLENEGEEKGLVQEAISNMQDAVESPFTGLWSTRIRAERDVQPEKRSTSRDLGPTGTGLTNLVRAFINSDDLPRQLVEAALLQDINEIYLGDSHFSEIICQENETSSEWEIYLREDDKGDIRLSQSGSSLRTVFIVLAFLRLYPEIAKTGFASRLIFCLEEPENNLHPALLRRLIDFLAHQRAERNFSLVITTHSALCIDLAAKRNDSTILHVKRDDGRTICQNAMEYSGKSSILSDLDVRGSDILQANGVIWVEGPSDRVYVNRWIEVLSRGSLREGIHYSILFYGGKLLSHFDSLPPESLPEKVSMLAINRNVSVVIDSDRRPNAWKTKGGKPRRPQKRLNATKREIIHQVELQGGHTWVTAGKEIENYVPAAVWEELTGKKLNIQDEYQDIPSIYEVSQVAATKVDLAHRAEEYIDESAMVGHLDLQQQVKTLCEHIRSWNGLR
ncbi:ATP-dependent nuclease [Palleronia pelagia]|uniref:Predicted ATP-dependent endonuclease of the OLD family, contains P-loop ATPase and TOPRIM domains n=1 Tax=Palleronia pelagia TaxID=387096 RepID=A0A1H8J381_9RHOB|nr:AAA family ATPase [Palleronia pelagia]SEN74736.1 Predicted ATP-dependent endonuclease of the OLD family, contains P-loop ATPase and TOPRIM domains [Palleronia pelagia]